jgi:hypothetical protein
MTSCTHAAAPAGTGKVVVLVVDRIGPGDINPATAPFLSGLATRWSTGVMVTHSAEKENGKEPDLGADYETLAAGVRAEGAKDASLSLDAGEAMADGRSTVTAAAYYRQVTGARVPADGVACLGFPRLRINNAPDGNEDDMGRLGGLLKKAGKTVAVAGNQDSFRRRVRLAPLVASDAAGVVALGRVAGMMVPDASAPGGYNTDMAALLAESRRLLGRSDVLVIDTGDTGRVDREWANTGEGALAAERAEALGRVDRFASALVRDIDLDRSLLLVVSPGAPQEARLKGDYLTPFIAAGKGFSEGLLTSGSTRRAGIVNNTDFLATVLDHYGIGVPSSSAGSAMETAGRKPRPGGQLMFLRDLDERFTVTREVRTPVVLGYLLLVGVFLLMSLACLRPVAARLKGERWRGPLMRFLAPASGVIAAAPLAFLLVGAVRFSGLALPLAFCTAYALVVGLGAWFVARHNRRVDPFTLVCLFSSGVILLDLLFGGQLLVLPLLGSNSLEGMRFFGISNVVAGYFLASAVWGISGLAGPAARDGRARAQVLVALGAVSFAIGFGLLGANFGGFIAAAATTLVLYFALSEKGFSGWRVPAIAGITVAGTALMVLTDSLFVHAHAGHAVAAGRARFLPLVGHKMLILLGQIKSVLFLAILLIAAVIALVLWMRGPSLLWRESWRVSPEFTAALFAISIGSVVALLFNDTGLTMMGTMMLVTIPAVTFHFTRKGSDPVPESVPIVS